MTACLILLQSNHSTNLQRTSFYLQDSVVCRDSFELQLSKLLRIKIDICRITANFNLFRPPGTLPTELFETQSLAHIYCIPTR